MLRESTIMAISSGVGSRIWSFLDGFRMPDSMVVHPDAGSDAARLVVEYHNSKPIDLLEFSASLEALAREHQSHMHSDRPGLDIDETRLLIIDVRKGSIILELTAALAPIISTMEVTNTAITFIEHFKKFGIPLASRNGRAPDASTQQLKNMGDTVQAIASDREGQFVIAARYSNGEVIQEFRVESEGARNMVENAQAQRREIEDRSSSALNRVLMRLHQSSVADPKVGKRTTEKGVIERIDLTPRTLVYVTDLVGQRIKSQILQPDGNPYSKGFIVDVDIETVGGRPKVYRILEVHEVLDLSDDE